MISQLATFAYYLVILVGTFKFAQFIYAIGKGIHRNFLRKPLDLAERYGKGSWAIVTGASAGIGEQFCIHLARLGFNIVLISRTKKNLDAVAENLKKENPGIRTRVIAQDLGKDCLVSSIEKIVEEVKDLDVSMLLNNAGAANVGTFEDDHMDTL